MLRLLLLESPDAGGGLLMSELLRGLPGCVLMRAATLDAALTELSSSSSIDCVLFDLSLPGAAGVDGVARLHAASPATAIVAITPADHELAGLESLRAGAADYLVTGRVSAPAVLRAIRGAAGDTSPLGRLSREHERLHSLLDAPPLRSVALGATAGLVAAAVHLTLGPPGDALSEISRSVAYLVVGLLAGALVGRTSDASGERFGHLAKLVDQSPAAITSLSLPDGKFQSWNRGAVELYGYSEADALGLDLDVLVPPFLADEAAGFVRTLLAGERVSAETQRLRRDGTLIDISLNLAPLRGRDGAIVGVTAVATDLSTQAAAVAAVTRSEDRFRGAFAHSPTGMAVVSLADDSVGRLLQVNPALCLLTGYSEEALCAGDLQRLIHPEETLVAAGVLADDQQTFAAETRVVRADGETIWVQLGSSLMRDDDGAPLSAVTQVQDITERKVAEQERSLMAAIVSSTTDAIVATDPDGVILTWNAGAVALYGYPVADALGRHISIIAPSGRVGEQKDLLASALGGASASATETQRVTRAGTIVDVSLTTSPVRDQAGAIVGASVISRDITADKQAARSQRFNQERLRQIVETADEGIWVLDAAGGTTFANQKMADILGTSVDAMAGATMQDFMDNAGRAAVDGLLDAPARQLQVRFVTNDRRDVWTSVSTSSFTPPGGGAPGTLVMVADTSEQRAAETERLGMEHMLDQSQRLESLGQLAGGVAHDMNNLLAIIINFTDFATDEVAGGAGTVELQEIRTAADRAADLIRQLLLFARQEVSQPRTVDVNALLVAVEKLLERAIGEHVDLRFDYDPAAPSVEADPSLLEQIVMNLAVNGRDAMPDGGTLRVRTSTAHLTSTDLAVHPGLEPGEYACLCVSDTGHGMSDEILARAFDPFFTTKPRGSGTGLGLATVYGAIARSGGCARIESEVGQGTQVRVYLPLTTSAHPVIPLRKPGAPAPAAGETILLVEDDDGLRRISERILAEHGYHVVAASLPSEALELVATHDEIDLLVTDVVMPEMSGPKLASALHEQLPGLPVVFTSGYSEGLDQLPSRASFLPKPFTRNELLAAVAAAWRTEVPA